jgi:hypothetical protein
MENELGCAVQKLPPGQPIKLCPEIDHPAYSLSSLQGLRACTHGSPSGARFRANRTSSPYRRMTESDR